MPQIERGPPLCSPSNVASKTTVSPSSPLEGLPRLSCPTKKYGMRPVCPGALTRVVFSPGSLGFYL